jgi:Tfp pilus assembly protein PilF
MDFRRNHPSTGETRDPVAAEFYRSGLHEWQTRSPSGLMRAANDFNSAIRRDPHYAQAYVGLADTYNLLREYTAMPADIAYTRARAAALRATALDPNLAGAHAALGFVDFYWQRDMQSARHEFSRALQLDPNSATTHHWYATVLMSAGDFVAARSEIENAAALDSESAAILADKGLILFRAGEVSKSVALLKQLEADQPSFASPHLYLSLVGLQQGNDREYLQEMNLWARARHDNNGQALAAAGLEGLSAGGHTGMLHSLLARRLALYAVGKQSAYAVAETYALLGDRKNALAYLATSFARREPEIVGTRSNVYFGPLKGTPEFTRLLALIGV